MNPKKEIPICLCHRVKQATIEKALAEGADSLPKIYDTTTAGVGPCGGSCRLILKKMLDHYLQHKEFLENPRPSILNRKIEK